MWAQDRLVLSVPRPPHQTQDNGMLEVPIPVTLPSRTLLAQLVCPKGFTEPKTTQL